MNVPMMTRMIVAALLIAAGFSGAPVKADDGSARAIIVGADPIRSFLSGSDQKTFGKLEFIAGLELWSRDSVLGGISAMRMTEDGNEFVGVMDTAHWFTGRFERDALGRLAGVRDFRVAPMRDANGRVFRERWDADAEGLVLKGDEAFVSYERIHRIERYRRSDLPAATPVDRVRHLIPDYEFRNNRGMEAIAIAPSGTPLDGAMVVVSERSLDKKGDIFAAVLDGPKQGVFFVRRNPPFDVTDGDFLPSGDLLLLERRFSMTRGVGMRIRRIAGSDIAAGETVDGEVLIDVDFSHEIDNMESLDVFTAPDGSTRLLLASDDNQSFLQSTIVLEF
ncbi:MAG: esterase-like activity of phytase family protein, partial [Pseudomonadota bacterium]